MSDGSSEYKVLQAITRCQMEADAEWNSSLTSTPSRSRALDNFEPQIEDVNHGSTVWKLPTQCARYLISNNSTDQILTFKISDHVKKKKNFARGKQWNKMDIFLKKLGR